MELNKNSRVQTLLTLVEVLVNQFWVAFLQDDFDKEFHLKWIYTIRNYKKITKVLTWKRLHSSLGQRLMNYFFVNSFSIPLRLRLTKIK